MCITAVYGSFHSLRYEYSGGERILYAFVIGLSRLGVTLDAELIETNYHDDGNDDGGGDVLHNCCFPPDVEAASNNAALVNSSGSHCLVILLRV